MKQQPNQTCRSSVLLAATIFASGLTSAYATRVSDANSTFIAADLDISSSLSLAEFTSTLEADIAVRSATRKFNAADRNLNGSIELTEYLTFNDAIATPTKTTEVFEETDMNVDGSLNFDEFLGSFNTRISIVAVRRLFLRADADEDGTISGSEWETYKRGDPTDDSTVNTLFQLADFDASGQLTVMEYGYVFPRTTDTEKILSKFIKLDADGNGLLSSTEYNPGVRPDVDR